MTTGDGYRWVDHLIENRYAPRSIKDVWFAALSATAAFMVERRKLGQNPFLRLKVRSDKAGPPLPKHSNSRRAKDSRPKRRG